MKESNNPNSTTLFNPFSGPEIVRIIPITQAQTEIWTACMFGGKDANRAYNESVSLILSGILNEEALKDAIKKLINRHEALRSTFSPDGRFMIIFKELSDAFLYKDISKLDDRKQKDTLKDYLSEEAEHVFDLAKGPLLKIGLIKLSNTEHQLVLTAHHMICDGWSIGIMLEELGGFYSAKTQGKKSSVPLPETYSSYVEEELKFMASPEYVKTENYWLNQYESSIPKVTLPTDFPRPQLRTFKGNRLDFPIDNELVSNLKKIGIQSGASLVVTLLAAFEVFLFHQTGQGDLVIGLPAAGQSQSGKTQLIGHCVNLLPLRSKLVADIPFNTYLRNRKNAIFDAYDHQQFSFGQLLQKLSIVRDPSRIPLVPIMFNIDMGMTSAVVFNGLNYKLKSNPRAYETFELFLNATGTEDELILEWSYNVSLFKSETIEQMMASYKEILHSIVAEPNIEIGNVIKVDNSIYNDLNDTQVAYPKFPLHELLAKQSQITPKKQAIKFVDSEISYKKLDEQVNQMAHYLAAQGIRTGDFVAVSIPRSIELVVSLIAIMKCGAAYLPLDPGYPCARLEFILEDSNAKYLITSKSLLSSLNSNTERLFLEDIFLKLSNHPNTPLNVKVSPDDLAYLLYTSGSTGKPKGVPITHKNLVNFLYSMLEEPGITENDKLLSITTISFDIAGLELFIPLLKGAQLVLANEETAKNSRLLLELMKDEAITIMQATPTAWQMLLDVGWESPLPIKALCGGEAMPLNLAIHLLNRCDELWNMYGPTETTIWSTIKEIKKDDELIAIGRPIANTQIYLLNQEGELVKPGEIGEITIGGDGVAKGYWNRPELTAEKFILNSFSKQINSNLYRTGDLGKLLPNGDIQCLGRIDQQVKIRGHRIELGEIETVLNSLEGINQSVVVASNKLGNKIQLVAYLKAEENFQDIKVIRSKVSAVLPEILCPSAYMFLQDFPLTPNGKIDKKNLPIPEYKRSKSVAEMKKARTKLEKDITEIWREYLNINDISIDDDFFELGGHSLLAISISSEIAKKYSISFGLPDIYKSPSVIGISECISNKLQNQSE
jgi:amino acid adenylation domain-containing protein